MQCSCSPSGAALGHRTILFVEQVCNTEEFGNRISLYPFAKHENSTFYLLVLEQLYHILFYSLHLLNKIKSLLHMIIYITQYTLLNKYNLTASGPCFNVQASLEDRWLGPS